MQDFALALVTPKAEVAELACSQVVLPTAEGQITVYAEHANYLGALGCGLMSVISEAGPRHFFVADGFVEAQASRVVVLATRAQPVEDIDLPRAEASLAAAEARLRQLDGPQHPDYAEQWSRRARAMGRIAAVRQVQGG